MSSIIEISIAIEYKENNKLYMIIYLVGHIFFRDPCTYIGSVLTRGGGLSPVIPKKIQTSMLKEN